LNQSSKVDENDLFHVSFLIALKNMIMFTNAQNLCQIIYRNVQALKWHIQFQNIFSRAVDTAICKPSKLSGILNNLK